MPSPYTVSFVLTWELIQKLRYTAKRDQIPISEVVRRALHEFFCAHPVTDSQISPYLRSSEEVQPWPRP